MEYLVDDFLEFSTTFPSFFIRRDTEQMPALSFDICLKLPQFQIS